MKPSLVAIVVVMLLAAGGCAQRAGEIADVRRENAELKSRVAALESEVADLKLQRTPLTVNGLTLGTLGPPPELKLTSTARPAEWGTSLGQGRITYVAAGGAGNLTITGTTIEKGATFTTTTTTKSAATSTTTTTPAK
jgi:hypothetical protein